MDLLTVEAWTLGWLAIGSVIGLVFHEAGHALAGWAVGRHPRLLSIGRGRTLARVRFGTFWVVLRAVPTSGYVMFPLHDGRLNRAVVTAGGPLANALLLAAASLVYEADPDAFGIDHLMAQGCLLSLALSQVVILVSTLFPKRKGRITSSDGWKLWRLITHPTENSFSASYERAMRDIMPPDAPKPVPSAYSAEIIYQANRPDRQIDPWALRQSVDVLRGILPHADLPDPERALVLTLLVVGGLVFVGAELDLASLDAWSAQALALAPMPQQRVMRGGVLVALGRFAEAEPLLTPMASGAKLGILPFLARLFLAQAAAGQGDSPASWKWLREARAAIMKDHKRLLLPVLDRASAELPQAGHAGPASNPAPAAVLG